MRHLLFKESFSCKQSAEEAQESLLLALSKDNNIKTTHLHRHHNEITFQVCTNYFLERNAFLPYVRVTLWNLGNNSCGIIDYCVHKATVLFLSIYTAIALIFECILLCVAWKLITPLILVLPVGLILFAHTMSLMGLFLNSKRVHRVLFEILKAKQEQPIKVVLINSEKKIWKR